MCGIAGVASFGRAESDARPIIETLGAALAHRGPDGEGSYTSPDGASLLVHRRLAIIDPSERGAQPMATPDGRFHITFNGEIYNYRELRAELVRRGVRFTTESDTEVLLRLLEVDGASGLARARGMFALGLWDGRDRTLLVARDRFGIKPLYVTHTRERVAFASEIGALRRAGLVSRDVSPAGVLAYLAWASIPAPLTWLRDVEAVEPGTWRRWSRDGASTQGRFADARAAYAGIPDDPAGPRVSEAELRERAARALAESVRSHLVADVPVGVFLSGGIDSGALVSLARGLTQSELHAYTVVVDETGYSEEEAARSVAAHFGVTHHVLRVDSSRIATDLPDIVGRLDQPTSDAVNTYYVSRAVAATGVKAVLSGVGGDELFGGYPSFDRIPASLQVSRALGPMMRAAGAAATLALPAWRAAKWRHFAGEPDLESSYRALRGYVMPEELAMIIGPALRDERRTQAEDAVSAAEATFLDPLAAESARASVARMETRGYLCAQLLRDIDAMSMAHGLEVRVPFVDHVLQQALWPALAQHPSLLKGKRLLHESLPGPLPSAITSAPKRGFTLPFADWMRGELRDATRDGLRALAAQEWIVPSAPDAIWEAWERGQAHWTRPWGLAMLGRFLEEAP